MAGILFDQIVFGPVRSRRLGVSLGINLLPAESKFCNFNCIYCECGWNTESPSRERKLPTREDVYQALEDKLQLMKTEGQMPDAITFAGNGEPTIHPSFPDIINDIVFLRDKYAPHSKISVLSNATMLHNPEVIKALKKTDLPMLKLDSALESTITLLNRPVKKINVARLIGLLKSFGHDCIIQTMFVRGYCDGTYVDNTSPEELDAWEKAVAEINPLQVVIYSIDRETPAKGLRKISREELVRIAERIRKHGMEVKIS